MCSAPEEKQLSGSAGQQETIRQEPEQRHVSAHMAWLLRNSELFPSLSTCAGLTHAPCRHRYMDKIKQSEEQFVGKRKQALAREKLERVEQEAYEYELEMRRLRVRALLWSYW